MALVSKAQTDNQHVIFLLKKNVNREIVRATRHKTPGESSEIRMRLLEECSTLYTGSAFRVSVIGAILVYLSITLVILEQA